MARRTSGAVQENSACPSATHRAADADNVCLGGPLLATRLVPSQAASPTYSETNARSCGLRQHCAFDGRQTQVASPSSACRQHVDSHLCMPCPRRGLADGRDYVGQGWARHPYAVSGPLWPSWPNSNPKFRLQKTPPLQWAAASSVGSERLSRDDQHFRSSPSMRDMGGFADRRPISAHGQTCVHDWDSVSTLRDPRAC